MVEAKIEDLRAAVEVARQLVTDWDTFVGAVESLTREHTDLKDRFDHLLQEQRALEESLENLRAAHESKVKDLMSLQEAHDALSREHEANAQALRDLQGRHEALQQDRQYASEELEAILRRLKP